MQNSSIFSPVSKRHPCPVCGGSSGCLVANEGGTLAVVCSRTKSPKPIGKAGWLHLLRDDGPVWSPCGQKIFKVAWRLAEEAEQ